MEEYTDDILDRMNKALMPLVCDEMNDALKIKAMAYLKEWMVPVAHVDMLYEEGKMLILLDNGETWLWPI